MQERWYDRIASFFSGIKREDMVIFTRQLATLLESQLPLGRALSMLYEQTTQPTLKEAVYHISQDVASGLAFSQAMERHAGIFSKFFVSMVRSAEVTGRLNEAVGFIADYTEEEAILVAKARSALTYPTILIGLFFVVAFIMVTVVFPQIQPVFEESGIALPIFSKILIQSGVFISNFWPAIVLFVIFLAGGLLDYVRTSEGKAFFDDLKIHVPIIRKIYVPLTLTRFGNSASMLVKGGVPLAQAMEIVAETIDNVVYQDVLHGVANDVRQGKLLSESLANHSEYFPSIIPQMIAVGEVTGQLDQIFTRITNLYRRETDTTVNNAVDLIQPVLMVIIGVLVGVLFAAILIPLYQLTGAVR
jgi:type II secretory pathway component PulF